LRFALVELFLGRRLLELPESGGEAFVDEFPFALGAGRHELLLHRLLQALLGFAQTEVFLLFLLQSLVEGAAGHKFAEVFETDVLIAFVVAPTKDGLEGVAVGLESLALEEREQRLQVYHLLAFA